MTLSGGRVFSPEDVYRLDESHIDQAVGLLARAFSNKPLWSWVLPDEDRRRRALPISMRATVVWGLILGESYGLGDPLTGIAIWAPPGMADADVDLGAAGTDAAAAIGPEGIARFEAKDEIQRPLREQFMGTTGWYLQLLGVDPAAQRTGAGKALLSAMFARLDEEGAPAYHETEHDVNVAYYLKQGYEIVHEGVVPDGGPAYWCFLRQPQHTNG
jgi:ribosomal protein S18 acetylase RimI-like enzyme